MRYIGNKARLVDFIFSVIEDNRVRERSFCDVFSGTANVAKFFKKKGYKVISNDFMKYSYVFQRAYIKNNKESKFEGLKRLIKNPDAFKVIKFLNGLSGEKGFIYENYCRDTTKNKEYERNYFTVENAMKIDAVRNTIERWYEDNLIKDDEYYILLTSLLEFIPSVSNIAGTYGSFLKADDPRMFKQFALEVPELIESEQENKCFNMDGNELVKKIEFDILYADPPYNSRQYASNYHILESVASWDKKIKNIKTGLRPYENQKSDYCYIGKCIDAFEDLVVNAKCKYILFSYSTDGIMSEDDILKVLEKKGKVKIYHQDYRRYKSNSSKYLPKSKLKELLYFVKVNN